LNFLAAGAAQCGSVSVAATANDADADADADDDDDEKDEDSVEDKVAEECGAGSSSHGWCRFSAGDGAWAASMRVEVPPTERADEAACDWMTASDRCDAVAPALATSDDASSWATAAAIVVASTDGNSVQQLFRRAHGTHGEK
jgi:hypothetical protein